MSAEHKPHQDQVTGQVKLTHNVYDLLVEEKRRRRELEEQLETLQRRNWIALEHANKGAAWSSSEEATKEDAARFHGALIFVIANLNGTLDTPNPATGGDDAVS